MYLSCIVPSWVTWDAVTAVATALMAIFILVAACIAFSQLQEMASTRKKQAAIEVSKLLQDSQVRTARGHVYKIKEKPYDKWPPEDKEYAQLTCASFDNVGIMVKYNVIDEQLIIEHWHSSIVRCWEIAKPHIDARRVEHGSDYLARFESLYEKARRFESSKGIIRSGVQSCNDLL